jgi:hypothetical protein
VILATTRGRTVEDGDGTTNQIASAQRCRLSEAEPQMSDDLEAQHRHLFLQGIAQHADLTTVQAGRRRVFRRSR